MLNRILPFFWHLLPLRDYVVSDMILLFRRQLRPVPGRFFPLLPLSRRQILKAFVVLQNFLLLLPRQSVESLWRRRGVRRRRAIRIIIWPPSCFRAICVRTWRTVRARILPLVFLSRRPLPHLAFPPLPRVLPALSSLWPSL